MNVVPLYRSTLKQLKQASLVRPHFLYELRFLLSLPVGFEGPRHVAGSTAGANGNTTTSMSALTVARAPLSRPSTECWHPDLSPEELFAMCHADLRHLIDANAPAGVPLTAASIGRHVSGVRELTWLEKRLRATLSDATQSALELALSVSGGPGSDDFIPDTAFATAEVNQQTRLALAEHGVTLADAPTTTADTAKDTMNQFQLEATPGGTYAMVDEKPSPRGAIDEHDAARIYSAGAVGMHREMFVLRHRDSDFLPMRRYFLQGLDSAASASGGSPASSQGGHTPEQPQPKSLSQVKVAEMAIANIPAVRVVRNEEVKLTVEVKLFDESYTNKSQAGIGYFEGAHRQFMVRFHLEPLAHHTAIRIANTQFARLDLALSELVEETGFLHSWDVKSMIQERDACMGIVSQSASGANALDDGDLRCVVDGSDAAEVQPGAADEGAGELRRSDVRGSQTTPTDEPDADANTSTEGDGIAATGTPSLRPASGNHPAREFSLAFIIDSDGPVVLKGLLYYQAAVTEEALVATPIHVIAFSHVLMNP